MEYIYYINIYNHFLDATPFTIRVWYTSKYKLMYN